MPLPTLAAVVDRKVLRVRVLSRHPVNRLPKGMSTTWVSGLTTTGKPLAESVVQDPGIGVLVVSSGHWLSVHCVYGTGFLPVYNGRQKNDHLTRFNRGFLRLAFGLAFREADANIAPALVGDTPSRRAIDACTFLNPRI